MHISGLDAAAFIIGGYILLWSLGLIPSDDEKRNDYTQPTRPKRGRKR